MPYTYVANLLDNKQQKVPALSLFCWVEGWIRIAVILLLDYPHLSYSSILANWWTINYKITLLSGLAQYILCGGQYVITTLSSLC